MAVRRLETTCPDCAGEAAPAGPIAHRRGCDGTWHLESARHVPVDPEDHGGEPLLGALLGLAVTGAAGGAALLVLSWWWLALLAPCLAVLATIAVRR